MLGNEQDDYLLVTSAGYGFITKLGALLTRNKKGKASLRVPDNAKVLTPQAVADIDDDWVAGVTNTGRLLIFTAFELPQLSRGKGVKLINIPKAKAAEGEELTSVCVFREGQKLRVHSGKRYLNLKPSDFENYVGSRAQRGRLLPRGFQQPHRIEAFD